MSYIKELRLSSLSWIPKTQAEGTTAVDAIFRVDMSTMKVEELLSSVPFRIRASLSDYAHSLVAFFEKLTHCLRGWVSLQGPTSAQRIGTNCTLS